MGGQTPTCTLIIIDITNKKKYSNHYYELLYNLTSQIDPKLFKQTDKQIKKKTLSKFQPKKTNE